MTTKKKTQHDIRLEDKLIALLEGELQERLDRSRTYQDEVEVSIFLCDDITRRLLRTKALFEEKLKEKRSA